MLTFASPLFCFLVRESSLACIIYLDGGAFFKKDQNLASSFSRTYKKLMPDETSLKVSLKEEIRDET